MSAVTADPGSGPGAVRQEGNPARGGRLAAGYRWLGPSGTAASLFLLVMLLAAVCAPLLAPYDPNQGEMLNNYAGSSGAHLLGTDAIGRDVFSRLVFGARTSLLGPALVVGISMAVGVPLALLGAWYGGIVDAAVARVLDLVYALPGLLLAVLTVALFGPGLSPAVIALSIAYVPFLSRIVRAAARQQRVSPYVDALSVQGFGVFRITVRHILPNIMPVVLGQAAVAFGYALLDLASLSYLGLAVQAPTSDWGVMVSDTQSLQQGYTLPVFPAGVLIVGAVLSLTVLGARISGERPQRHPLWGRLGRPAKLAKYEDDGAKPGTEATDAGVA